MTMSADVTSSPLLLGAFAEVALQQRGEIVLLSSVGLGIRHDQPRRREQTSPTASGRAFIQLPVHVTYILNNHD